MGDEKIDIEKVYNHWIATSEKDYETMIHLFENKDYHWALFVGHIVIERLLKAKIVIITLDHAPFSHDLRRLAKLSKIEFQSNHFGWLDTITTFNLNARYDSYKQAFYEKCSPEFTAEWISNIKELRVWIKQML
jgi:HEPN domain-containing protein